MDVTVVVIVICLFFFFQAEDGIRDVAVTGVQTCALPISFASTVVNMITPAFEMECGMNPVQPRSPPVSAKLMITPSVLLSQGAAACAQKNEIGRASCRERV